MPGLLLVFAWYLFGYQAGHATFGGIMGQMMGNSNAGDMALAMPSNVWGTVAVLAVGLLAGIAGLAYFLVYPEIRTESGTAAAAEEPPTPAVQPTQNWAVLLRTSKPEERLVLEALKGHGGSYLQKFLVKETGLSRLKTHRIVSRLAERGVVTVSPSGNTNEVTLAPWARGNAVEGTS